MNKELLNRMMEENEKTSFYPSSSVPAKIGDIQGVIVVVFCILITFCHINHFYHNNSSGLTKNTLQLIIFVLYVEKQIWHLKI